jgi:hypothetical protein
MKVLHHHPVHKIYLYESQMVPDAIGVQSSAEEKEFFL